MTSWWIEDQLSHAHPPALINGRRSNLLLQRLISLKSKRVEKKLWVAVFVGMQAEDVSEISGMDITRVIEIQNGMPGAVK